MAEPFKKQLVWFYTPEGRRCEKYAPGAIKEVVETSKYYGFVVQPSGKRKQIPLCPDLASSKKLLNKLLADSTMRQHGMIDPFEKHRKQLLAQHLSQFRITLGPKGNKPAYVALVVVRLQAVIDRCGWHVGRLERHSGGRMVGQATQIEFCRSGASPRTRETVPSNGASGQWNAERSRRAGAAFSVAAGFAFLAGS